MHGWEENLWFSKTTEAPVLPMQSFIGLQQDVAVCLVTRAVLYDMLPSLNGDLGRTLAVVSVLEKYG